jgi:hypothetical protein
LKRERQTLEDIVKALSPIEVSWEDEHSRSVAKCLVAIPTRQSYSIHEVAELLDADFNVGLTVVRLFLDLSKDEFLMLLRSALGASTGGVGQSAYRKNKEVYLRALANLKLLDAMAKGVNRAPTWQDVYLERLKSGRGSAIRGQARGRFLEDLVEKVVKDVFGPNGYQFRCRFVGASGKATEKADFAIPTKNDPNIVIEVKAYGATGSKQTDIIGDMERITRQKRPDTDLLLVTDGLSWTARLNDLRKFIELQNEGRITRIYTQKMFAQLRADLMQLRREHGL